MGPEVQVVTMIVRLVLNKNSINNHKQWHLLWCYYGKPSPSVMQLLIISKEALGRNKRNQDLRMSLSYRSVASQNGFISMKIMVIKWVFGQKSRAGLAVGRVNLMPQSDSD